MALFQTAATKDRLARIAELEGKLKTEKEQYAVLADVIRKERDEKAIDTAKWKERFDSETSAYERTIDERNATIKTLTGELAEANDKAEAAAIALKNHKDSEKATKSRTSKAAGDDISKRKLEAVEKALFPYKATNPVKRAIRIAIDATK